MLGATLDRLRHELRAKGIDLAAYNTEASADDLEDLRIALGVPKISLFGFSYGTHLGLAAIRRHPSSIDRVILAGTEGPDDSQKYPHTFDLQLARLAQLEGVDAERAEADSCRGDSTHARGARARRRSPPGS